jgi:hypothetical protein
MTKRFQFRFQLIAAILVTLAFAVTAWRAYQGYPGRKGLAVIFGVGAVVYWYLVVGARRQLAREATRDPETPS